MPQDRVFTGIHFWYKTPEQASPVHRFLCDGVCQSARWVNFVAANDSAIV